MMISKTLVEFEQIVTRCVGGYQSGKWDLQRLTRRRLVYSPQNVGDGLEPYGDGYDIGDSSGGGIGFGRDLLNCDLGGENLHSMASRCFGDGDGSPQQK
jgi:hypothetical protein